MSDVGSSNGMSGQAPVYVHAPSNCLYVLNPATGQPLWVMDYQTGQPMVSRQLFVDPATGNMYTTSLTGAGYVWLIDPVTGGNISQRPVGQQITSQQHANQQGAGLQGASQQGLGLQGSSQQAMAQQNAGQQGMSHQAVGQGGSASASTAQQNADYGYGAYREEVSAVGATASSVSGNRAMAPAGMAAQPPMRSGQNTAGAPAPRANAAHQGQEGTSGLAITALVLSILAIATSFLPIINNGSFFVALIGFVFAVIGIAATGKRGKKGRGLAIAGLVLSIFAVIIVIVTQSMFSAALDSATDNLQHGSTPVASTSNAGEQGSATAAASGASAASSNAADYSSMAVGDSVTLKNGLSIAVTGVQRGIAKSYSDETVTAVTVTYTNNGTSNVSFNPLDWQSQDANGVLDRITFFPGGDNELKSGSLAPGGSVSGNIYFEDDIVKVYYYENSLLQSDSSIAWVL